jgi:Galactose oxidase, central domain
MRKPTIVALIITALFIPNVTAQEVTMQPRAGHRMIYSPERDIIVMFGGMTINTGSYYNDLWTYSPEENTWTKITTENAPSPRGAPGFAYNPDKQECLLFGGLSGSRLSDTWTLSLDTMTWTKQSPATSPSARSDTGLVYDRTAKRYLLYGGYGAGLQEDTWAYDPDENNWMKIETEHSPGKIYGQSMMWNPASEQVIMYGGHLNSPTSSTYLNEVWGFNDETQDWEKLQSIDNVQGRYWTAADITENGLLVCFGGSSGTLGDTVTVKTGSDYWSTTSFTQPTPSPRFFAQICYIGGDRFILYGGGTSDQEYGDTWQYSVDSGWTKQEPTYTAQGEEKGIIAPAWMILIGITLAITLKRYRGYAGTTASTIGASKATASGS